MVAAASTFQMWLDSFQYLIVIMFRHIVWALWVLNEGKQFDGNDSFHVFVKGSNEDWIPGTTDRNDQPSQSIDIRLVFSEVDDAKE
jgi:hypothetical protein